MGGWVEEEKAVGMRCCGLLGMGGWVGGWVGGDGTGRRVLDVERDDGFEGEGGGGLALVCKGLLLLGGFELG